MTVDYTQPRTYEPPQPQPGQPPQKTKSGCGKAIAIGCIIVIILGVLVCAAAVFVAFSAIKSTDLYKEARDRSMTDPRVIAAIGPSHAGWWVTGNVHVNDNSGQGSVKFPLEGTKGDAKVEATATLDGSKWEYTKLIVKPENGPPIDLLKP